MKQVLLKGTKTWEGTAITVWAPDSYGVGDTVRWNGSRWQVSTVYGTTLSRGTFVRRCDRPGDGPLEKFN